MQFVNTGDALGAVLVVGTNSYVTNEEASTYVKTYYPSGHPMYSLWFSLSVEDQNIALLKSTLNLEQLSYAGVKTSTDQVLSFPRYTKLGQRTTPIVPPEVKAAQVENALYISDPDSYSKDAIEDEAFYRNLRSWGITSYHIGNVSETLGAGNTNASAGAAVSGGINASSLLPSPFAQSLIAKFLVKGASIR